MEQHDAVQQSAFATLVEDIHRALGLSPPAVEHDPVKPVEFNFEVDDVEFRLVHGVEAKVISAYCRFGHMPEADTLLGLRRLLQMNLALAESGQQTIAIDSESNDVIYVFKCALEGTTAADFVSAVEAVADQARLWRSGQLFDRLQSVPAEAFVELA